MKYELLRSVGFGEPILMGEFSSFEEANDSAWGLIGKDFGLKGDYTTSIKKDKETGEQRIVVSGDARIMVYIVRDVYYDSNYEGDC